jgi:signal peptidase II
MDPAVDRPEPEGAPSSRSSATRWAALALVAVLVFSLDQLTKRWALNELDEPIDLFWTLRFRLSFNTGVAFSLAPGMGPVVALLAVLVVGFLVRTGRSLTTWPGTLGLALVVGGACGNLADRVFRGDDVLHGAVVDFIDLQWWPIFNVADAAVVCGAILLAWRALRAPEDDPAPTRPAPGGSSAEPRPGARAVGPPP